jgi:hypothetical protein
VFEATITYVIRYIPTYKTPQQQPNLGMIVFNTPITLYIQNNHIYMAPYPCYLNTLQAILQQGDLYPLAQESHISK